MRYLSLGLFDRDLSLSDGKASAKEIIRYDETREIFVSDRFVQSITRVYALDYHGVQTELSGRYTCRQTLFVEPNSVLCSIIFA